MTPRRRFLVVLAAGLAPWVAVTGPGGVEGLVFAWGLLDPATLHVVSVFDYLFRFTGGPASLPGYLLAWPTGAALYVAAAVSAGGGLFGVEDRRVTGGLLALAGLDALFVSAGLVRAGVSAWPVGAVVLWAVAAVVYGDDLRRAVGRTRPQA